LIVPERQLSAAKILTALQALGDELSSQGIPAQAKTRFFLEELLDSASAR
jgi:hypothetical protein